MTRILSFADGFTSATAPTLPGMPFFQSFTVPNSAIDEVLLNIDSSLFKTAFCDYELLREDIDGLYIQQGKFIMAFNGTTWNIVPGNFTGVDMLRDPTESLTEIFEVKLTMNSGGDLMVTAGTMSSLYSGSLKLNITRVAV